VAQRSGDGYGLSETAYAYGYALRVKYSSFLQATWDWLEGQNEELFSDDAPGVLSLGCGDGTFDVRLLDWLASRRPDFRYLGVDCNATALDRFRDSLALRGDGISGRSTLKHLTFDASTGFTERFDLVCMMHFLHSFAEVLPVVTNALRHLEPGGKLLIVQQGSQGVYELKRRFQSCLGNPKLHSADEVRALLVDAQISFSSHTIDCCFDVSVMKQLSLESLLLMSFCFGDDLTTLGTEEQERIRKAFLAHAHTGAGGARLIHEPMEAILCEASDA
jgi:SAM-dependent methyltransferase